MYFLTLHNFPYYLHFKYFCYIYALKNIFQIYLSYKIDFCVFWKFSYIAQTNLKDKFSEGKNVKFVLLSLNFVGILSIVTKIKVLFLALLTKTKYPPSRTVELYLACRITPIYVYCIYPRFKVKYVNYCTEATIQNCEKKL